MDISQKPLVESIRHKYGDSRSSHAFNNLYIWHEAWNIDLYVEDDMYAASIGDKGENKWYFPVGSADSKEKFIRKLLLKENVSLLYMSEQDVEFLQEHFPGCFTIERDESSDEYVYSTAEHMSMPGRRYKKFRNSWNKFTRSGQYSLQEITGENIAAAYQVLDDWYRSRDTSSADEKFMRLVEKQVIDNHSLDDIKRYILYIDTRPIGVAAGYPLNDGTFDLCIGKCVKGISGGAYVCDHAVIAAVADEYSMINFEEDLGLSSLRLNKQALRPVAMNKKWRAEKLKGDS